jgi:hypothetical protein
VPSCAGATIELRVSSGSGVLCNRTNETCVPLPDDVARLAAPAAGAATFVGLAISNHGSHAVSARAGFGLNDASSACAQALGVVNVISVFQQIDTHGAFDVAAFTAGGREFLTVSNYKDDSGNTNIKSDVYTMNDDQTAFVLFQQLDTIGARRMAAFAVGNRAFLAIAYRYDGSSGNLKSEVFAMNGDETAFEIFQQLDTRAATDVEAFAAGGRQFIAFSNYKDGSSYNTKSDVYTMNDDQTEFVLFQQLDTIGAHGVTAFAAGGRQFLAFANFYDGSTYNREINLYTMNGEETAFEIFQKLDTRGAQGMTAFAVGRNTFLAVSNHQDGTKDSYTFSTKSDLYILNDDQTAFTIFQQIDTHGAAGMAAFAVGGDLFLAVANLGKGTKTSSNYNIKSDVYTMNDNQTAFELFQQLDTIGAQGMAAFAVGNRQLLAVINSYDGSIRNLKSDIYALDVFTNYTVVARPEVLCSLCSSGFTCPSAYINEPCLAGHACVDGVQHACPPGKHQPKAKQAQCLECPPGHFQNSSGEKTCQACPAGTSRIGLGAKSALDCAACRDGTHAASEATTLCDECPPAKFSAHGAGTGAGELLTSCEPCPSGTFSEGGAKRCSKCTVGRWGNALTGASSSECLGACPASKYSSEPGATDCTVCEAGTHQPESGRAFCPPCAEGTWSSAAATNCSACAAGTWSAVASAKCSACESGRFRNASMAEGCVQCLPGNKPTTNSTACAPYCRVGHFCQSGLELKCSVGNYQDEQGQAGCKQCASKFFQDEAGQAQCVSCNSTVCANGAYRKGCGGASAGYCVSCKDGEFVDRDSNTCRSCPRISADKEAVCTGGKLTLNDGFVSNAALQDGTPGAKGVNDATVFAACPCKECCHVSFNSFNSTTAMECRLNTRGTLCAVCEEGYHHQFADDPCVACTNDGVAGFIKRQTALFVALGLFVILAAADARFGWRMRKWLQERLLRMWHRLVSKTKILVNFMQLVMLFSPVYGIRFPPAFTSFLSTFSFVNLDFFRWLPLGCYFYGFNFYDELMASTLCFLVLVVAVAAVNVIKGKAGKSSRVGRWAGSFAGAALVLTFAAYPSTVAKIFSTFNCGTVEHADGATNFLRADYSIECDSDTHGGYAIFAGFMVLAIAVGTPVVHLMLLRKSPAAQHLLFLSQDYTQECWYVQLTAACCSLPSQAIINPLTLLQPFAFKTRYWEAVESSRKLVLTGFAVFVAQGTVLQLVLSFMLSLAFLICVVKMRPYRGTVYANAYAIMVNALIVAVLFVAILIEMDLSLTLALSNDPKLKFQLLGWDSDELGYGLIALVSLAIGSWAGFIAYDFDDTRDAKLLAKYVPPKEVHPGSRAAQLQLLELEAKLDRGEYTEPPRATMDKCFAEVRAVLDEAVTNGASDQAQLRAVQQLAGMEHKHAYAACHDIVVNDGGHTELLEITRAAAEQYTGVDGGVRTCKQQTGDLCTLYAQAREVLPAFKGHMNAFVAQFNGSQPTVKLHTSPLKHLYRCMEKMCLKGGGQRYKCFNICDIDRCIIECDDCGTMAAVLRALLANKSKRVIRVKDRASHLTSMNWMDVMVNIVLVSDQHVHVCEIQVVHAKMFLARKGLGGHGPYGQVRAASEILAVRETLSGRSLRQPAQGGWRDVAERPSNLVLGQRGEEGDDGWTSSFEQMGSTFSVGNPILADGTSSVAHGRVTKEEQAATSAWAQRQHLKSPSELVRQKKELGGSGRSAGGSGRSVKL